jgi:hypothetical protein
MERCQCSGRTLRGLEQLWLVEAQLVDRPRRRRRALELLHTLRRRAIPRLTQLDRKRVAGFDMGSWRLPEQLIELGVEWACGRRHGL